jgi:hypothetical protein
VTPNQDILTPDKGASLSPIELIEYMSGTQINKFGLASVIADTTNASQIDNYVYHDIV